MNDNKPVHAATAAFEYLERKKKKINHFEVACLFTWSEIFGALYIDSNQFLSKNKFRETISFIWEFIRYQEILKLNFSIDSQLLEIIGRGVWRNMEIIPANKLVFLMCQMTKHGITCFAYTFLWINCVWSFLFTLNQFLWWLHINWNMRYMSGSTWKIGGDPVLVKKKKKKKKKKKNHSVSTHQNSRWAVSLEFAIYKKGWFWIGQPMLASGKWKSLHYKHWLQKYNFIKLHKMLKHCM